jgi:hypothetical protein
MDQVSLLFAKLSIEKEKEESSENKRNCPPCSFRYALSKEKRCSGKPIEGSRFCPIHKDLQSVQNKVKKLYLDEN